MSWAAHELESYFLQKHIKMRVSYIAVLLGCLLPDFLTKLPVYGLGIGDMTFIKASFPAKYHRGWPGVGPTHSLLFGVLVGLLVLWRFRDRGWALGLLIGQWAHVLTDMFDSVGTMLFFPFTTQHYSTGMWAYAAQQGRYGDAAAYYSSLGGVWDMFWLVLALTGYHVLTRKYFLSDVAPNDRAWGWMQNRFDLSERALLAIYRAYFVYGACRIFAWFIWARIDGAPLDLSWGGPDWVQKVSFPAADWGNWFQSSAIGIAGTAALFGLIWVTLGRRLWNAAR